MLILLKLFILLIFSKWIIKNKIPNKKLERVWVLSNDYKKLIIQYNSYVKEFKDDSNKYLDNLRYSLWNFNHITEYNIKKEELIEKIEILVNKIKKINPEFKPFYEN